MTNSTNPVVLTDFHSNAPENTGRFARGFWAQQVAVVFVLSVVFFALRRNEEPVFREYFFMAGTTPGQELSHLVPHPH